MKLSSLLQSLHLKVPASLIARLRGHGRADETLGRFVLSVRRLLADPELIDARHLIIDALKRRFRPADVVPLLQRLVNGLPQIDALLRALDESSGLSDAEREDLARKYYPLAFAWAERNGVRDPDEVVTMALMEALDRYQPGRSSFPTFLFGVLRWRLIDWRRTQSRRAIFDPIPEGFDPPAPASTAFADLAALEASLMNGWAQLSPMDQRLVWLHCVAGLSFPEMLKQHRFIGCRLHQPTMRSRTSRAIRRLRSCLLPFEGVSAEQLLDCLHRVAQEVGTLACPVPVGYRRRRGNQGRKHAQPCRRHQGQRRFGTNPPPPSES